MGQLQNGAYKTLDLILDMSICRADSDDDSSSDSDGDFDFQADDGWGGVVDEQNDGQDREWRGIQSEVCGLVDVIVRLLYSYLVSRKLKEIYVYKSIKNQAHKKPVAGPSIQNPFMYSADREVKFWSALSKANRRGSIPKGYGLTHEEGSCDDYRTLELLEVGSKADREVSIILPREV